MIPKSFSLFLRYKIKKSLIFKMLVKFIEYVFFHTIFYVSTQTSIINLYNKLIEINLLSSDKKSSSKLDQLLQEKVDLRNVVRMGSESDGGYIMHKPYGFEEAAISIGIGENVSWEKDMSKYHIPIYMFDHTIKRPPFRIKNSYFFRVGLGCKNSKNIGTLPRLLELASSENFENMILKIDIEGAEWEALAVLDELTLQKFSQIIIEMHEFELLDEIRLEVLKKLIKNHKVIHINPNNNSKIIRFNEILLPNTLEVSLLREDLYGKEIKHGFYNKTFANDTRLPSMSNLFFLKIN